MYKFSLLRTGVAALVMGGLTAQTAQAQETTPVQKPASVSIGVLFPSDGDVTDTLGNNFLLLGASYEFTKTTAYTPTLLGVYLDYTYKERDFNVGNVRVKGSGQAIGIGASVRHLFTPPTTQTAGYVGLGLGIYNTRAKASATGVSESEDKTGLGGKVFLGFQANAGIFGEIEYDLVPEIDGDQIGGFGLRLGYRF